MSTSSMVTVSSTVNMMMQPVASVMSRVLMAETVRRPMPGQEKTVSIATAPPSRLPSVEPNTVMMGISAFFSACLRMTIFSLTPLARAVRR